LVSIRDPIAFIKQPYHCLFFYLPRGALNAIGDDVNAPRVSDLNYKAGAGINDVTIFQPEERHAAGAHPARPS
jgi:AraC family transcriptional regulator